MEREIFEKTDVKTDINDFIKSIDDKIKELEKNELVNDDHNLNVHEVKSKKNKVEKNDWMAKEMPDNFVELEIEKNLSESDIKILSLGHKPASMDDKWFYYVENNKLYAHRSWTGNCIFIVELNTTGKLKVKVNNDKEQYNFNNINDVKKFIIELLNVWSKSNYDYYKQFIKEASDGLKEEREIMDEKSTTNNEYDYSNIIPTEDYVLYLVRYCNEVYSQMIKLMNEEEEKNKQFKLEYKQYMYKKSYGTRFEIYIREKTYNNITCKDLIEFESAVKDGNLKNINSMEIKMNLDFRRGNGNNLEDHENSFTVKFEPYKIIFARKSNYIDQEINQVESAIKQILDKFPKVNSIFCTK